MKVIKGDLIELAKNGEFDVIIHGCNCFCTMGAGIAKSIKKAFPQALKADKETSKGCKKKLGSFSSVTLQHNNYEITVVNAYTQYDWRGRGNKADYAAIRQVMKNVAGQFSGKRIAYPLIGAGLAGGDWRQIAEIIDEELNGENHCLVVLPEN